MNRKPGYGAKLRANLEPTKGVGRLRQQDGGHGRGRGGRCKTLGVSLGGAAVGADLGGSSKYSNENFEGRRGERFHVNGTCTWPAHPGNDSVGGRVQRWKSTARRAVSGAPPAPLKIRRTECLPRPVVLITASGLQGLALRAGHGGPSPEPVGCRRTARAASAARAGRRVPAGDGLETAPSGAFPGRRTANSELRGNAPLFGPKACLGRPIRAEDIVRIRARSDACARRLFARPAVGALRPPQRHVSMAKPVRRMSRAGRHESTIPIKRRVESFADDLNTRRGIVSGRVALLPRSLRFSPASLRFVPPP
ncbi:hypothetical protein L1887_60931 [Cichorium endivia]|nr:hypothetical protein L1887_60931 [Cichorium endivia]